MPPLRIWCDLPTTSLITRSLADRIGPARISAIVRIAVALLANPVVERTGLAGLWTFELSYALAVDSEAPPLPTALQDQLGLRLESTRGPVDVMVIESVQQPTEN
jgi:uncharacterized protein (TIGR03435 family)